MRRKRFIVHYKGTISNSLSWDISLPLIGGWLVVDLGRFKWRDRGWWEFNPRIYWSRNGTGRHHSARNIFRAPFVNREECVCDRCLPVPKKEQSHE